MKACLVGFGMNRSMSLGGTEGGQGFMCDGKTGFEWVPDDYGVITSRDSQHKPNVHTLDTTHSISLLLSR